MRFKKLLTATAIAAAFLTTAPTAFAQASTASVVVVHGIPDTTVDVYVNDKLTIDNFTYGTVTDALSLPAGTYDIAVRAGDAAPTAAPLLTAKATLAGGDNVSLVAHLSASGDPKLTAFANDTTPIAAGNGRLVVRHTAAAPAVDVLAGGKAVFRNLSNPGEAKGDLPAGTVSAAVALAGTTTPVIGPADVPVTEGASTIVYAVGSAEAKDLKVLVQTISGMHSSPGAVNTGNSGLVADGHGSSNSAQNGVIAAAAAAAMAGAGLFLVRRRQTA